MTQFEYYSEHKKLERGMEYDERTKIGKAIQMGTPDEKV